MDKKKIIVINNEKIFKKNNEFYCDNIDIKSIPEELSKYLDVRLIARSSNKKGDFIINLKNINAASNIFFLIYLLLKSLTQKKTIYFIISITPFTFLSFLILKLFGKKTFVYLRSNGYEEYRAILGSKLVWVYHLMYIFMTRKSNLIVCQKRLVSKEKFDLVFPSQLDNKWINNQNKPSIEKIKLLYVGRIKVEKGIFSLLTLLKNVSQNIELSIVGRVNGINLNYKNLNILGSGFDANSLIKIYDNHNIFILPSFTEAHPQVLDESLSRLRPVIIFEDIKHVIKDKIGIFVSERNPKSLLEKINYIMKNYDTIQNDMRKNKLPNKEDFIKSLVKILN